jgi:peptide/nickel transport system substrate-binding protein
VRSAYRPGWPLLLVLIVGVGAVLALIYATSRPSGEALPVRGGSYVEGVAGNPTQINPLFTTSEVEEDLSSLIFAGLVRLGPRGDVQPDLAERWSIGPDGKEYTFNLRRNLFWHDGQRLDADDVIFTINAIQDPDFEGDERLSDVFRGVEAEATDKRTVVITLPEQFAPFLAFMTAGILPEHLLKGRDAAALREASFNERPVGSGPFRLVGFTSKEARLKAFDDYHLDRPLIDELTLRFYRDDATLLTALLSDEVDGALFRPGLNAEDLSAIDSDERWSRRSLHTTRYSLVYLNQSVEAFKDRDVRRALQIGLDREALIDEALGGQAIAVDGPIVPGLWAYQEFPEAYAFDAAEAASLLAAAGWQANNGTRTKDGATLEFTLSTIDDPDMIATAEAIARQWKQIGIQVTVQTNNADQFRQQVLVDREFEAALGTIQPPGPDPDPYPFWHSTQTLGEGRNLAGFADAEADGLLEDGRQSPKTEQRAENYRDFQEIFARELPAVLLYTPTYYYVVNAEVQGMSPGLLFTLSARFHDIQSWSVETGSPDDGDT